MPHLSLLPIPSLHPHPPSHAPSPSSHGSGGSSASGGTAGGQRPAATVVHLAPTPSPVDQHQLPLLDLNLFTGLQPLHSMHSRYGG
jgi:hypothetical protein